MIVVVDAVEDSAVVIVMVIMTTIVMYVGSESDDTSEYSELTIRRKWNNKWAEECIDT